MAKSLLKTVIDSSRSKTEEREKTKRAQLRKEAAAARDEAAEARRYARNTSAAAKLYDAQAKQIMAEEKARATQLQQNLEYKAKIDSYIFDTTDASKLVYQLSELQSEVQNGLAEEGITGQRFTMAYNKYKLGLKMLENLDPTNFMLEDFKKTMDDVYKHEHYLSLKISSCGGNNSYKYRLIEENLEKYTTGEEKNVNVLLDALKTLLPIEDELYRNQQSWNRDHRIRISDGCDAIRKRLISLYPENADVQELIKEDKKEKKKLILLLSITFGVVLIGILIGLASS